MLAVSEILEAVETLLAERFPEETIYRDLVPSGFTRPSFLVGFGPLKTADAGCGLMDMTATATVTAYIAVDEYGNSQTTELALRMTAILELFAGGYLAAGDRALRVSGAEGEYGSDCATVKVTLSYTDERSITEETFPAIGEIQTTIKI